MRAGSSVVGLSREDVGRRAVGQHRVPTAQRPFSPLEASPSPSDLGSSALTPWGLHPPLILTPPWLDMTTQDRLGERAQPSGGSVQPEGLCRECPPSQASACLVAGRRQPQGTCCAIPCHCCLCRAPGSSVSAQPVSPSPPRFMEFEAEEEMQIQKLQLMKGAQGQPPPAPPRPDPQGSPAPVLGPQPGTPGPSHRSPGPRPQGPRTSHSPHPHWSFSFKGALVSQLKQP